MRKVRFDQEIKVIYVEKYIKDLEAIILLANSKRCITINERLSISETLLHLRVHFWQNKDKTTSNSNSLF
jgi:hypothetical protein